MNGYVGEWEDGCIDGQTEEAWVNRWMGRQTDEQIAG